MSESLCRVMTWLYPRMRIRLHPDVRRYYFAMVAGRMVVAGAVIAGLYHVL